MAVKELSQENFNDFINSEKPAVVDFFATWCGPCRMLSPVIDGLSDKIAGEAQFGKLDIDKWPDIAAQYGVMSVPTVIRFENGAQTAQSIGYLNEDALREALEL